MPFGLSKRISQQHYELMEIAVTKKIIFHSLCDHGPIPASSTPH